MGESMSAQQERKRIREAKLRPLYNNPCKEELKCHHIVTKYEVDQKEIAYLD